jgi:hypothetical protein
LPAVQYAIFPQDPIPLFKAVLNRMEKPWLEQLNKIDVEERRQTVKQLQQVGAWNHLFKDVRGDEVYLLLPAISEIALMSTAMAGKKWVVSKAVQIGDRRLAWNLPFEAVAGQEVAVKLSKDNALDLAAIENADTLE